MGQATTTQLGPADAGAWRFGRLSRQWAAPWQVNRRPPHSPLGRWPGQGLLLASVMAWLGWSSAAADFDTAKLSLVWISLIAASALAIGLILLGGGWRAAQRPIRFDLQIRQALTASAWVVVHNLSWQDQRAAVGPLRQPAPGARL